MLSSNFEDLAQIFFKSVVLDIVTDREITVLTLGQLKDELWNSISH